MICSAFCFVLGFVFVGLLSSCSSFSKSSEASSSDNSAERNVSSEGVLEQIPLCASLKYEYAVLKPASHQMGNEYQQQAAAEARKVWEAAEAMEKDTSKTCVPQNVNDLSSRPRWCLHKGWRGPYLKDQRLLKAYEKMTDEDFQVFLQCWR